MIEKEEAEGPSSWEVGRRVGEEGCDYACLRCLGKGKRGGKNTQGRWRRRRKGRGRVGLLLFVCLFKREGGEEQI